VQGWALRLSYAGELGWEIYAPVECGLSLWDALWEAGHPLGIVPLGNGAFDSLRLEKGYRLWGTDVHAEHNLYEAGLGWTADLGKGDFVGREALVEIERQGVDRKLCCLTLDDGDAVVLGKEPILAGAAVLGYVTSANYGYAVGQYIAYGYLPVDYSAPGTQVEVEYFGKGYKATVRKEPLYDPQRKRMTS
jgi:glycine cleavage system aminomethyltransferase T